MGAVTGQKSEAKGQNVQCGVSSMANRDVLEPHRVENHSGLENTALAHKTAPVLILNMHLTGRIATGLFALQDGVFVTSKIRVYDGVPVMQTLEVVR